MKAIKRLNRYLKGRYKYLVISIILIIIIQVLGFISPLIVKSILDDYILGIEYSWVEISEESDKTVVYNGKYYKQERFLNSTDEVLNDVSIVVYKNGFYFINEKIETGNKEVDGDNLYITSTDDVLYTYKAIKLSVREVASFYSPVVPILITLIIILFFKSAIVIFGTYGQRMCSNKVVNQMTKDARIDAIKSLERLPIKYFEKEPAGKMAARITSDVDGLIIFYRLIVNVMMNAILSFVFAYIGMFYLDKRLALLSFIVYPLVYIWIKFFLKYLKKIAIKVNEYRSLLTAKINEIINGINILQVFNFKKQTVNEFNTISKNYMDESLKEVKLHVGFGWNMINLLRALVTVLIVIYFGYQYLSVSEIIISAGLIYAYNEYILKIIDPIAIIFTQVGEFQHSLVKMDRLFTIIEGEKEDDIQALIPRYKGEIKFDNVWFSYVDKDYVLKGISFEIKPGQMVGLVGHTGSGKSSLMNLLLRFYDLDDPLSGKIYVDGIDIASLPRRSYRQHIGIVLQEPIMFKGTIASNIRFGKDISDEEVKNILISIGGEKILEKFDKGINQEITRSGVNLSSGEKQIISLARCIVHDPAILIMDEATSHIDTETEEMIKKALEVVCKNRTVIVIAHRLSTIYNADNIIVIDHGLKVEEGRHEELVKKNGVYANIYRSQIANVNIYH